MLKFCKNNQFFKKRLQLAVRKSKKKQKIGIGIDCISVTQIHFFGGFYRPFGGPFTEISQKI